MVAVKNPLMGLRLGVDLAEALDALAFLEDAVTRGILGFLETLPGGARTSFGHVKIR